MRLSTAGETFIKLAEGFRGVAYLDGAGIPTIGYGHIKDVHLGMTCTEEEADTWFQYDVLWAEEDINAQVKAPLNQNQFDALVSFTFNEGRASFETSSMLRFLNEGDYARAAKEFPRWDKMHKNGVLVSDMGLARRRKSEQTLFNTV